MPRREEPVRPEIVAAQAAKGGTVKSSGTNVFLLDLPVLGLVPLETSRVESETHQDFRERSQASRPVLGGQVHYKMIMGAHPCYARPTHYTTIYLLGGGVQLDLAIPYDQWMSIFQQLGAAFANAAREAQQKQIVTPAEYRGGGL